MDQMLTLLVCLLQLYVYHNFVLCLGCQREDRSGRDTDTGPSICFIMTSLQLCYVRTLACSRTCINLAASATKRHRNRAPCASW